VTTSSTAPFETGGTGASTAAGVNIAEPQSFLDTVGNKVSSGLDYLGNSVSKNPLGAAVAGGGLLKSLLMPAASGSEVKAITSEANALGAQGSQLASYLQTGTLPPGMQAQVTQATQAAITSAVSRTASQGGDVTKNADGSYRNSTLQQEVDQINMNAITEQAQLAENLLTTGINETGLSSQLYQAITGIQGQQNAQTGTAIANLATALSGGTTIKINAPSGTTAQPA
jgi:hypothetical protein